MVWLLLEVATEVIIIVLEFILYLLLLISQAVHAHSLDVLLEVSLSRTFHKVFLKA